MTEKTPLRAHYKLCKDFRRVALARRFERASPQSPIASNAMKQLRARGDELVITPQTLYELWVVLTRPVLDPTTL